MRIQQNRPMSINLLDPTRNQHFLPQVEQRLNAIDPTVCKEKQSIYEFEVLSREPIQLGPAQSTRIEKNLSMLDLFSFDVDRKQPLRHNFEMLFNRYETDVRTHTESLLAKLAAGDHSVGHEVTNIFAAKILNFARNPFSVQKILNTFGALANFTPLRQEVGQLFDKVLFGRRKHQIYLCGELGITDAQYDQWLRMLFNMLMELAPGFPPMLDQLVNNMFNSKAFAIGVLVSTYDSPTCLLSDRGFSTNVHNECVDGFDFNLRSNAFIRYVVMDRKPRNVPAWMPQASIDAFMQSDLPVSLNLAHENTDLLRSFNMNVINQCHSRVFCSVNHGIVC